MLVNGQGTSFKLEGGQLVLENLPEGDEPFELEIFTTCAPAKNTQLMGLYVSNDSFFTQCEAEGFRRITYFLDRPDVMASYTVTLRADKAAVPGAAVQRQPGGLGRAGRRPPLRHAGSTRTASPATCSRWWPASWCAASSASLSRGGKEHLLQVYVRPGDLDKTEHAMNSLMASVAWDEARFGLALDLERFMIVATSDFNMGAMENKGLNIFNTKYVLASQATATDTDFANIEIVVGHEYFHNWTGNRVTCRDWFQLSLKEGLTVFRDQEFSQDLAGEAVGARRQAHRGRARAAHRPVPRGRRPDGAPGAARPVPRDQQLLHRHDLREGRRGRAHDADAGGPRRLRPGHDAVLRAPRRPGRHLRRLRPGHRRRQPAVEAARSCCRSSSAGTARPARRACRPRPTGDAATGTLPLTLSQSCPPTPGQTDKEPVRHPGGLGLLGAGRRAKLAAAALHVLTQAERDRWCVDGLAAEPVPSLLRGFSAPVILEFDYTDAQLLTLLAHDTDPFNRWEAGQRLAVQPRPRGHPRRGRRRQSTLDTPYLEAMRSVLRHPTLDAAFKELVLTLPAETYIAEQLDVVDPQRVHAVREAMREQLASALHARLGTGPTRSTRDNGAYRPDPVSSGRRALAGLALTHAVPGGAHDAATRSGPARPTSASRTPAT